MKELQHHKRYAQWRNVFGFRWLTSHVFQPQAAPSPTVAGQKDEKKQDIHLRDKKKSTQGAVLPERSPYASCRWTLTHGHLAAAKADRTYTAEIDTNFFGTSFEVH